MKYSVLTAVHNGERFIDSYFETVFSQTICPDEIILIDDKLNPYNFEEIIEKKKIKYNFKNIFLIKNNKNLGPCISLNKGISFAKNKLILRLDFDDQWKREHAEYMINSYKKDSSYLFYFNIIELNNLRKKIKYDKFFINENFSIHSSWLINLNIIKNFKYYLENPTIALEDYFTISYYTRRGFKFFVTEKNTVLYNDHLMGHGKLTKRNAVKDFYRKRIAKSLFSYHSRLYFNQSKSGKFFFILKNFGIFKYLVFVLWTIDCLNLRKFIRG
jgi:glycosyltransferase involved in cell wall biosynthesis